MTFDVGDKYFVVRYYERVEIEEDGKKRLLQNVFKLTPTIQYIHNYLVISYYGFDMSYQDRHSIQGTTYLLRDEDSNKIRVLKQK